MPKFETTNHYYSFDLNELHIISINSQFFLEKQFEAYIVELKEWLVKDLQRTFKTWKIVMMHHSLYCISKANGRCTTECETLRGHLEDIFITYGVNVVLAGHEHNTQWSYPINKGQLDKPEHKQYAEAQGDDNNVDKFKYRYDDPIGPVYLICGSAGSSLGLYSYIDQFWQTAADKKFFSYVNGTDVSVCEIKANVTELTVSLISSEKENVLNQLTLKPFRKQTV
jgi:hypothetical protein